MAVLVLIFIHVIAEIQILCPLGRTHFLDGSVSNDKPFFLSRILVRKKRLIEFFCFLKNTGKLFLGKAASDLVVSSGCHTAAVQLLPVLVPDLLHQQHTGFSCCKHL